MYRRINTKKEDFRSLFKIYVSIFADALGKLSWNHNNLSSAVVKVIPNIGSKKAHDFHVSL
jgi:hypothetical protein